MPSNAPPSHRPILSPTLCSPQSQPLPQAPSPSAGLQPHASSSPLRQGLETYGRGCLPWSPAPIPGGAPNAQLRGGGAGAGQGRRRGGGAEQEGAVAAPPPGSTCSSPARLPRQGP